MLGSLGWEELLIILVILALLFGASRVAGLGGALGRGIREFRSEASKPDDPASEKTNDPTTAPSSSESTRTS
jgi:sec-independent protein translocase protein TatA